MKSSELPNGPEEDEVEMMRRALGLRDHASQSESPLDPRNNSVHTPGGHSSAGHNSGGHFSGGPPSNGHASRHDPDRRARRFVRDGEVPVVVLNRQRDTAATPAAPSNRVAIAETALRNERIAKERAERALHEAQDLIQQLKTQVGHGKLAHAEAIGVEREAREALERRLAEMTSLRNALEVRLEEVSEQLETARLAPVDLAPVDLVPVDLARVETKPIVAPLPKAPRKLKRAAPPIAKIVELDEPQAVKWWLPSFKVKARPS